MAARGLKHDGFRVIARKDRTRVRLHSRVANACSVALTDSRHATCRPTYQGMEVAGPKLVAQRWRSRWLRGYCDQAPPCREIGQPATHDGRIGSRLAGGPGGRCRRAWFIFSPVYAKPGSKDGPRARCRGGLPPLVSAPVPPAEREPPAPAPPPQPAPEWRRAVLMLVSGDEPSRLPAGGAAPPCPRSWRRSRPRRRLQRPARGPSIQASPSSSGGLRA